MKRIFIVNPVAGKGKALKISKALKEVCESEKLPHEFIYTKDVDDARKIARRYRSEYGKNIVYSVGGDGTLNEVVNGIANSGTILGVIPGGTGNDFYKMIGPSGSAIQRIDVGKVNDRYFINIASLGLDAKIAKRANEINNKYIPSSFLYYISILLELIKLESINLRIDDRTKSEHITMLSVCNGAYYGGGIKLAPFASIRDGLFEVYEFSKMDRLQVLKVLKMVLSQNHEKSNFVDRWRTDYFVVESYVPLICNVDGEIIVDNKFVFDNIEDGVHLMYNDHPKIMSLHNKNFK